MDSVDRRAATDALRRAEELTQLNRRLAVLTSRLIDAQEGERRRIARELHDDVGQALTALKLTLQAIQMASDPDEIRMGIADAVATAATAIQRVRDLSLDLRPSLLDDLGLPAAVRWYVDRQSTRASIEARVDVAPDLPALTRDQGTTLFRILQEAVTNVVKHAQATSLGVELSRTDRDVRLAVRDNGIGFDADLAQARAMLGASVGVLSMSERAQLAGGRITIASQPGTGTTVTVWLPIDAPANADGAGPDGGGR
jgi:signal transduction histidine kinase